MFVGQKELQFTDKFRCLFSLTLHENLYYDAKYTPNKVPVLPEMYIFMNFYNCLHFFNAVNILFDGKSSLQRAKLLVELWHWLACTRLKHYTHFAVRYCN